MVDIILGYIRHDISPSVCLCITVAIKGYISSWLLHFFLSLHIVTLLIPYVLPPLHSTLKGIFSILGYVWNLIFVCCGYQRNKVLTPLLPFSGSDVDHAVESPILHSRHWDMIETWWYTSCGLFLRVPLLSLCTKRCTRIQIPHSWLICLVEPTHTIVLSFRHARAKSCYSFQVVFTTSGRCDVLFLDLTPHLSMLRSFPLLWCLLDWCFLSLRHLLG